MLEAVFEDAGLTAKSRAGPGLLPAAHRQAQTECVAMTSLLLTAGLWPFGLRVVSPLQFDRWDIAAVWVNAAVWCEEGSFLRSLRFR